MRSNKARFCVFRKELEIQATEGPERMNFPAIDKSAGRTQSPFEWPCPSGPNPPQRGVAPRAVSSPLYPTGTKGMRAKVR